MKRLVKLRRVGGIVEGTRSASTMIALGQESREERVSRQEILKRRGLDQQPTPREVLTLIENLTAAVLLDQQQPNVQWDWDTDRSVTKSPRVVSSPLSGSSVFDAATHRGGPSQAG